MARRARGRARKGAGHLYRRGRVWWIKWTDASGKPHFRSSNSSDYEVAAAMLRDLVGQRDRGVPVLPDPRRLLVDTLLENLLPEYRAKRPAERGSRGSLRPAGIHSATSRGGQLPASPVLTSSAMRIFGCRRRPRRRPSTASSPPCAAPSGLPCGRGCF